MNFPETIEGCLLNVKSTGNWEWYDKEEINIWKAKENLIFNEYNKSDMWKATTKVIKKYQTLTIISRGCITQKDLKHDINNKVWRGQ